jgi:hypothetical protein
VKNRPASTGEIPGGEYLVWTRDVNQVVGNAPPFGFGQFSRTDLEKSINLHGIAIDNFALEFLGNA